MDFDLIFAVYKVGFIHYLWNNTELNTCNT
jgi:hypothetical protein